MEINLPYSIIHHLGYFILEPLSLIPTEKLFKCYLMSLLCLKNDPNVTSFSLVTTKFLFILLKFFLNCGKCHMI